MTISLICPDKAPEPWIEALKAIDPQLDIRVWPNDHPKYEVELVLTWNHQPGSLMAYANLGCISSMGAGVDHLLSDPNLPQGVPIVRLVDTLLVRDMAEYLVLAVLSFFRQFDVYQNDQKDKKWQPLDPLDKNDLPIGIMGMGQLGQAAAERLEKEGFSILGWKNTPDDSLKFKTFFGKDQLNLFLNQSRILICLLPLTDDTRHILNLATFSQLIKGGYLINVGRGGHLKEPDLITALDQGILSGACLDVFETEPLKSDHPFWNHPNIRITPHISSQTTPCSVAPQIIENLARLRSERQLLNPVNIEIGY
ncbi:MAG: glyoxylate/hydroxypyruvate reductase A [Desulfobacterales bacterium]|nr:glyoxylate/hydroxypyruvate reductase A [Desulfobacterales bacterium]